MESFTYKIIPNISGWLVVTIYVCVCVCVHKQYMEDYQ
jgi:hypothetical protein